MLNQEEKDSIIGTMKMFANNYMGEDLIKQTARYVSATNTTWKRKMIYDYSRKFYNERYEDFEGDAYIFEIDGVKQYWFCVLWYDGPRIFENGSESAIMVQYDELSTLEIFDMIYCSNDTYTKMVEEDNSTIRKTQKTLNDRGIGEKKVFMFYDRRKDIDIPENTDEKEEDKPYRIYDWSDELYDTNPEWFI